MRRLSLRGRMVMTAVGAAGVALGVLLLLAGPSLDRRARSDAFAALTAEARLMARVVEDELARGTGPDRLDPVVDAAAREVGARVTVIAADGKVLADSVASGPELAVRTSKYSAESRASSSRTLVAMSSTIKTRAVTNLKTRSRNDANPA